MPMDTEEAFKRHKKSGTPTVQSHVHRHYA
nr:MAG TPA: hypothetical protein [Caudoviricetes sp.]